MEAKQQTYPKIIPQPQEIKPVQIHNLEHLTKLQRRKETKGLLDWWKLDKCVKSRWMDGSIKFM
jgi:hypothetical protein